MPKAFSPDQLKLFLLLAGLTYLLTAPSGNSNPANRAETASSSSFSVSAQPSPSGGCPSNRRFVQLPSDAVLNVRQSPNGPVLTTLMPGSAVALQQLDRSGQWSWVTLGDGTQGWVFNQYLSCG